MASTSTSTSTSTTSTTTTSTTSTTIAATTTTVSPDLSYADIPIGTCDTITDGAIGYRNETGHVANAYERIGGSAQGRPIWAEHWGTFDGPQVLVVGQEHGDECAPAWFVRAIREQPPTTFGIWLVPTANPDGLAAHTRRTAEDVDPNRDGFRLATPEARAVMYATERYQPVLTIHVHSPYQWIGAHNGGLATEVGQAMSDAVGWGPIYRAGRVEKDDLAFLWEGQELVIPGHQSVLIEFPAITEAESPAPPDPSQKDVADVATVAALAIAMRDAFYTVMGG
ncbi:MAG: hypothetical protein ABMA25_16220 [Ilumatobacteraceae bacterium]